MTSSPIPPLMQRYPVLQEAFPVVHLATLPTPVGCLTQLEATLPVEGLWIKRDDRSAEPYGGNKVRKLEYLLGWAQAQGHPAVLTFGAAGSNHALATSLYAQWHGLRCHAILSPQENSPTVRKNLLGHLAAGTTLHPVSGRRAGQQRCCEILCEEYADHGRLPFVIPPGGSSPLGMLGYVNAGLELAAQIEAGELPRPDAIYVASGTMGTCIGLLIGLQCAGLDMVQVVAVRVTVAPFTSPEKGRLLHQATGRMLHDVDPAFPCFPFPEAQFILKDAQLGAGYGFPTVAGEAAVQAIQAAEGISLEGTYTGKALAGLVEDAENRVLCQKKVLFWNTYNSQDLTPLIQDKNYRDLPDDFHAYFTETEGV